MRKEGQTLLLISFLLMLVAALATGLSVMLKASVKIRSCHREGTAAFYLAQAAVERGKAEVLYAYWTPGAYLDEAALTDQNDLDIAGDNYNFRYDVDIVNPGPPNSTERVIIGTGRVLDLNGNEIARREIIVSVEGIEDVLAPVGIDDDGRGTMQGWSWREI